MPHATNTIDNTAIYYETEGNGPPLLLHHELYASGDQWRENGVCSALGERYRLILIDARGHGRSAKPAEPGAYRLQQRVSDVTAVLDDMKIERTHFLGYSLGGQVGFGMARFAPERLRSMVAGGIHPYATDPEHIDLVIANIDASVEASRDGSADEQQLLRARNADAYRALVRVFGDDPMTDADLVGMSVPTIIFMGGDDVDDDRHDQARQAAEAMPNARFLSLPGLDHGQAVDIADRYLPQVVDFLAAVESGARTAG